jgi:hypothetical protein
MVIPKGHWVVLYGRETLTGFLARYKGLWLIYRGALLTQFAAKWNTKAWTG